MRELNLTGPTVAVDWRVKKGAPVCVVWRGVWYRGLPVNKKDNTYKVFLIDLGYQVSVIKEDMRPLPEEFLNIPPFAYQVRILEIRIFEFFNIPD